MENHKAMDDALSIPLWKKGEIVVGIGEALWDMLPDGKQIGGAPANFAYHISQFGIDSCVVSAVGADSHGNEIFEIFKSKGLQALLMEVPYPTGRVEIEVDAEGIPQYDIVENVAWDNIPFSSDLEQLAHHTCAVCFGSLAQRSPVTRHTISKFLEAMKPLSNKLIVCDVNLRQDFFSKEVVESSLNMCNILKINDEELPIVCSLFGIENMSATEACKELLVRFGLKLIILTCGTKGSYVYSDHQESFIATPSVTVADTVGAGDSFTAAFIASLLKGKSLREAHQTAVETSAFVCTQKGAMPKLPAHITTPSISMT